MYQPDRKQKRIYPSNYLKKRISKLMMKLESFKFD